MKLKVGETIKCAGQLIALSKRGNIKPRRDGDLSIGISNTKLIRGRFAFTVNGNDNIWTSVSPLTQVSISYFRPEFISDKIFPRINK